MQVFQFLCTFALAGAALANPTVVEPPTKVSRDLATITSVVAQVSAAIVQLDAAVQAFEGDDTELQAEAEDLITILTNGQAAVEASSALSLLDALSLSSLVTSIEPLGEKLVSDMEAKVSLVEQYGFCETVEAEIIEIAADVKSLIEAVISKAPTAVQGIAEALAESLYDVMDEGVAAFAPGNCTDATPSRI
ncbi:hypothetical protein BX600DRAFT_511118 [Xylariales sp. PMI_506]|nr:hypothetical protein BX600DRAFT_511118 [Xylariales sp. PMI_506]